jgi:ribulose-phosphate 3-epimerase
MPQIVPAILEKTKEGFLQKLSLIIKLPGVERVQADFGDGEFIESKLLSVAEMDALNPAFHWEAHLMIKEPKDFLDYQICGFKTLIVHYEAFLSAGGLKRTLSEIKSMGFKTCVAINPDTSVNVLKDIIADQYLIMSVVPGKQGQSFLEGTFQKIKDLKALLPHAIIEVDGGVNAANVKQLAQSGADLLCVGSALVKAPDVGIAWEKLNAEINRN